MKALVWPVVEDESKQASRIDDQPRVCFPHDQQAFQDQVNQVSRPDADAQAWQKDEDKRLAAKQKLHDLGLPPDPSKITAQDLGKAHMQPKAHTQQGR